MYECWAEDNCKQVNVKKKKVSLISIDEMFLDAPAATTRDVGVGSFNSPVIYAYRNIGMLHVFCSNPWWSSEGLLDDVQDCVLDFDLLKGNMFKHL